MTKNEKSLTALLAIAIIILLLLWFNARRKAIASGELDPLAPLVMPNLNIWQWNIPPLGFSLPEGRLPTIGEIYYANGSCMCQG